MPLPATTYKFSGLSGRRREWIRALIVDSKLYFAPPSSFNDPLDCRVPPSFQASKLTIETFWRKRHKELGLHQSLSRSQRKKEIQAWVTLTRTPEGRTSLAENFFESIDDSGVACFSESPRNMLLWSYYAEGHAGVAIRFNTGVSVLAQISHHVIPVRVGYQDDFPKISYYTTRPKTSASRNRCPGRSMASRVAGRGGRSSSVAGCPGRAPGCGARLRRHVAPRLVIGSIDWFLSCICLSHARWSCRNRWEPSRISRTQRL